jgi:hypothetical protein
MDKITLSELAAVLGMILGTAGFVTGLMNYLRDRPMIKVGVNWHMEEVHTAVKMGMVFVTNLGRRPIFISAAVMLVPKGFDDRSHFLLAESIPGKKLSEGDAPVAFKIDNKGMEKYAKVWREVRVYVEDSAGRKYFAKKLARLVRLPERCSQNWSGQRRWSPAELLATVTQGLSA